MKWRYRTCALINAACNSVELWLNVANGGRNTALRHRFIVPTIRQMRSKRLSEVDPKAIMTVIDLARYLNCHTSTIYRLLRQREIPAFRLGGDWRFQRDAIDEWVEKLTKVGPPKRPTDTHKKGAGRAARRKKRRSP